MAQLQLGATLKTTDAVVDGPTNLKPGRYRVQLVVIGTHGTSDPAVLTLVVQPRLMRPPIPAPIPVPRPVTPTTIPVMRAGPPRKP